MNKDKWGTILTGLFFNLIIAGYSGVAQAATLNVPGSYLTIQAAIDAALTGDEVLVADGTYVENINFMGKAITVRSLNGPTTTIIDGNTSGSVVSLRSGEGTDSILDGFSLINGSGTNQWMDGYFHGGAIFAYNASFSLNNCIITQNRVKDYGGGIYVENGFPVITSCTFNNNESLDTYGGGGAMFFYNSPTTLDNCQINNNTAGYGGGIYVYMAPLTITDCQITDNIATQDAGGICFDYSSSALSNCLISGNQSFSLDGGGGGIACYSASPTLNECTVSGNYAEDHGGGIACHSSSPLISNSMIDNNFAKGGGGGFYTQDLSSASIINSTITNNSAANPGGGIFCENSSPAITNSIISGNAVTAPAVGGAGIACYASSSPEITNCIISGNAALPNGTGGGIACFDLSSPSITNCTISGNHAFAGGGIHCLAGSSPMVVNTLLWGNKANGISNEVHLADAIDSILINYSDINPSYITGLGTPTLNNTSSDNPLFVDPRDASLAPTVDGNYRLDVSSLCFDGGTSLGAPSYDIEGTIRPQGAGYDMGAYEGSATAATTVTLTPDNSTPGTGEQVCIQVDITTVTDLYAISFDLSYDATVLDYNGIYSEGSFLNEGVTDPPATQMQAALLDGVPGQLVVGITRLEEIGGISGSGDLAEICFDVIGASCTFSAVGFSNQLLEGPALGSEITASWIDSSLDVELPAPTGLVAADALTHDRIDLSWTAVAEATAGYEIYRSDSPDGPFVSLGTSPTNSYQDTGCIIPTLDYYYQVRAIGDSCESQDSTMALGSVAGLLGDINNDGRVNGRDLSQLARTFGTGNDCRTDLDRTGLTDGEDLIALAADFGKTQ